MRRSCKHDSIHSTHDATAIMQAQAQASCAPLQLRLRKQAKTIKLRLQVDSILFDKGRTIGNNYQIRTISQTGLYSSITLNIPNIVIGLLPLREFGDQRGGKSAHQRNVIGHELQQQNERSSRVVVVKGGAHQVQEQSKVTPLNLALLRPIPNLIQLELFIDNHVHCFRGSHCVGCQDPTTTAHQTTFLAQQSETSNVHGQGQNVGQPRIFFANQSTGGKMSEWTKNVKQFTNDSFTSERSDFGRVCVVFLR